MASSIYLDHAAGSPPSADVVEAMRVTQLAAWANPASVHQPGQAARRALDRARREIAECVGVRPDDLIFVSSGTEACNLAVCGLPTKKSSHILTTAIEHPAVLEAADSLERRGTKSVILPVDGGKPPSLQAVDEALAAGPALFAVQWVNHETGVVFPVQKYASLCQQHQVPLFVDASQAVGKLHLDISALGGAAVAFAAHKVGGPAGAGALWVRRDVQVMPTTFGGAQERGRRAGTPSVALLAGFACAVKEVCAEEGSAWCAANWLRLSQMRTAFESSLCKLGGVINGADSERAPHITNVSFRGVRSSDVVAALDIEGVHISSGAACSSGLNQRSKVVEAMFPKEPWRARGALRFSFASSTAEHELSEATERLSRVLQRLSPR